MKLCSLILLYLLCRMMTIQPQPIANSTCTIQSSVGPEDSMKDCKSFSVNKWTGQNMVGLGRVTSHVFKRGAILSVHKQAEIKASLQSFIERLRTYITESGFLVEQFLRDAYNLAESLENLLTVYPEKIPRGALFDILEFSRRMFREMTEAAAQLQGLSNGENAVEHLIYYLVELNVRVLALYDDQGRPNLRLPRIKSRVSRMNALLQHWIDQFEGLGRVPLLLRTEFMIQRTMAERSLRVLSGYMVFRTNRR